AAKWLAEYGIELTWRSMGEYLDVLESIHPTINCITLVGHGTVRSVVMGNDDRPASPDELAEMRRLVEESMEAGAFGLSSGLIYPPSCYGDTEELIEVCKGVAPFGGFYASHIRNESEKLCEAVQEAITIGKEAGVGVQISHHKACGKPSWGLVSKSLAIIDKARADGIDVWADQYPYVATSTGLGIMFPKWAYAGGSRSLTDRLKDPDERRKIREEMIHDTENGWIKDLCGWEAVVISSVRKEYNKRYEGRSIAEIAEEEGKHPVDTAIDLMIDENGSVGMVHFVINEEDVKTVMAHPAVLIGSDATARSTSGPLSRGKPHPRAFGTFVRVLGKYVREEGVLTLEQAVAKMTGMSAKRLGLIDRGIIAEGYWADITIFNPKTVSDAATFKEPLKPAIGIEYVVVNGKVCLEKGRITDEARNGAGRIIRRGRD
ncbi:MAG: amidohydrolase family protein, partial [Armatimonadota bacterium]|nr:amidohydrolase family protein [Armatimonadota bacterium]